jgi:DNA-binding transcriptional ArsR family regulator
MMQAISLDPGQLVINDMQLRKAMLLLKSVDHGLRMEILQFINEHEEVSVTYIYKSLRVEQSVASQHLATLRKAGIVIASREGKRILYSINHARLTEVQSIIAGFLKK